jgi:glycosyltransferase involved in cell wall biosynthesis
MYRPAPWSISLNMMVKNCEVEVGRILMYYYSIIREFIVADTGSSDNTKSFLDEAKIPYFEMSLNDNFAEARNNLIEKSTMKYCMQIDPDEQPEARTLEKIAVMLNRDPDVCISHLSNLQKNGNTVMTKQPRIWRRSSEICFSGRVHETLEKSLKKIENVKIQDTNLTSTNTGFLMPDEQLQEKLQFYASLLEKEIEESPDNAKAYYELALHCRNTNDPKRALELLKQAVKIHPGYLAAIREIIMIKLYQCYQILLLTEGLATDEQTTKHMTELHNDLKKYALTHQKVGTERHNFSIKTLEDIGSEG